MEKKLLCAYCRKLVDYELETRFTIVPMMGERISFAETYGICKICGKEIFIPQVHDHNMEAMDRVYRITKERKGNLTMNQAYQNQGMYCKAQNCFTNEWITGTYIGKGLVLFPSDEPENHKDESDMYVSQVKLDTICRSTGRENEFEYDVVQLIDDDEDAYLIIYSDEDLAWQMLSIYSSDMINLGEIKPDQYVKLGNIKEDDYWRKEWERQSEKRK